MRLTRRGFLMFSGAGAGTVAISALGFNLEALAASDELRLREATETTTVCPYCSVGCSAVVSVIDGKVVNVEGLPDSPINRGMLCSKGSSMERVANSDLRLDKVRYRAPNSNKWEEKTWDEALTRISELIKETRDSGFTEKQMNKDGIEVSVNRCDSIVQLGGAALDTEECYLASKFARGLGIVWIDHQARI